MNGKGQISIEFLLIMLIMLLYLQTIIRPGIDSAEMAASDVQRVDQTNLMAEKLASSINEIAAASGDTKKTIQLFLPENVFISCDVTNKTIDYNVGLEHPEETTACPGNICTKSIALLEDADIAQCIGDLNSALIKNPVEIEIEKTDVGINVQKIE